MPSTMMKNPIGPMMSGLGTMMSGPISRAPVFGSCAFEEARIALAQQPCCKPLSFTNSLDLRCHRLHPGLHSLQPRDDVRDRHQGLRYLRFHPVSTPHEGNTER